MFVNPGNCSFETTFIAVGQQRKKNCFSLFLCRLIIHHYNYISTYDLQIFSKNTLCCFTAKLIYVFMIGFYFTNRICLIQIVPLRVCTPLYRDKEIKFGQIDVTVSMVVKPSISYLWCI